MHVGYVAVRSDETDHARAELAARSDEELREIVVERLGDDDDDLPPGLCDLLDRLVAGDVLVALRPAALVPSWFALVALARALRVRGAHLVVLEPALDSRTPAGAAALDLLEAVDDAGIDPS